MPNYLPELDSQRAPAGTSFPSVLLFLADASQDDLLPTWNSLLPWPLWNCPLSSIVKLNTLHWRTLHSQMVFPFPSKVKKSDRSCRMGSMCLHMQCHPLHIFARPPSLLAPPWEKAKDNKVKPKFPWPSVLPRGLLVNHPLHTFHSLRVTGLGPPFLS